MKKYLVAACLFLANNEIVSLIALCFIGTFFLVDMAGWVSKEGKW